MIGLLTSIILPPYQKGRRMGSKGVLSNCSQSIHLKVGRMSFNQLTQNSILLDKLRVESLKQILNDVALNVSAKC